MIRTDLNKTVRKVVEETLDLDTLSAATESVCVVGYTTASVLVTGPLVAPALWEGEVEWSPDGETWTSFSTPVTITGASYVAGFSVSHAGWIRLVTTTENGDVQTADVSFVLVNGDE